MQIVFIISCSSKIDEVVFPGEFYVLELSKVRYVESGATMNSNLGLRVNLKVDAILPEGCFRTELLQFLEVGF